MAAPTQARACAYFNYDPDAGHLIHKSRPQEEFANAATYACHQRRVGKVAGSPNAEGYIKVHIDGHYYSAHHIIWLIVTGEWIVYPENEIDHRNGKPADNSWKNLRKVTKSQNQRNASQRVNNTSGIHGVNWKPATSGKGGGWVARIWNGPRHVYLGVYREKREAMIARKAAERVLGFTGTERPPSEMAVRKRAKKIEAAERAGQ